MRKSARPPNHPHFEFVTAVLPAFAKRLASDLRLIGRKDLAAQVKDLRIYDVIAELNVERSIAFHPTSTASPRVCEWHHNDRY